MRLTGSASRHSDDTPARTPAPLVSVLPWGRGALASSTVARASSACCVTKPRCPLASPPQVMEHEQAETTEQRKVPHRDFYNIRKVRRPAVGRWARAGLGVWAGLLP